MRQRRKRLWYPAPESFDNGRESEQVRRLSRIVAKMPGPAENVFEVSKTPKVCGLFTMVAGQYLGDKGFEAVHTPAYYTRFQPQVGQESGPWNAALVMYFAWMMKFLPNHMRDAKQFAAKWGGGGPGSERIYNLLYTGQDSFITVGLPAGEEEMQLFMVHGAYRQFFNPRHWDRIPPVILDRVDKRKLRRKYHLILSSQGHVDRLGSDEDQVFSRREPRGLSQFERQFRNMVRVRYQEFSRQMDRLERRK